MPWSKKPSYSVYGMFDGMFYGMFDGMLCRRFDGMLYRRFDGMLHGRFDGMLYRRLYGMFDGMFVRGHLGAVVEEAVLQRLGDDGHVDVRHLPKPDGMFYRMFDGMFYRTFSSSRR